MPTKPLRSIRKRRDFELVFKEGISFRSQYLVLYARPNELNINRLGLSVSKKIGKAVIRNRIRRLLKEAVKKLFRDSTVSYDVVIVARKLSAKGGLDDFIRGIKRSLPKVFYEKSADISDKII
jgi:ribonuclease P protein component